MAPAARGKAVAPLGARRPKARMASAPGTLRWLELEAILNGRTDPPALGLLEHDAIRRKRLIASCSRFKSWSAF
jgi:hypothetical protein